MTELTLGAVAKRVELLERENRFMKRVGGAVLLVFAAVMSLGQAGRATPVVEAQRFLIRDPNTGKGRAALSLLQDGSVGLSMTALDGKSLSLSADAGGKMGLTLHDNTRKLRAELFAGTDGAAALALRDATGKVIWRAP